MATPLLQAAERKICRDVKENLCCYIHYQWRDAHGHEAQQSQYEQALEDDLKGRRRHNCFCLWYLSTDMHALS